MRPSPDEIRLHPIGIIRSPHKSLENMPVQPGGAKGVRGEILLDEKYGEGLEDLEGFSHIILIYHFHQSRGYRLKVVPFLDDWPRGLFATRAPRRPNPIGISIVRLIQVNRNVVIIENVDVLDKTPLLDIKPYVAQFDTPENPSAGWIDKAQKSVKNIRSDSRFRT